MCSHGLIEETGKASISISGSKQTNLQKNTVTGLTGQRAEMSASKPLQDYISDKRKHYMVERPCDVNVD